MKLELKSIAAGFGTYLFVLFMLVSYHPLQQIPFILYILEFAVLYIANKMIKKTRDKIDFWNFVIGAVVLPIVLGLILGVALAMWMFSAFGMATPGVGATIA